MGSLRFTTSRLRFPHVKTRRLEPSKLFLLLQHRTNDNRRLRISGRCWTTLRGKCARGGTTLLPDSTHFSKRLPRITGDVWRSKHTVESSASLAGGPLPLGESYGPRSTLCTPSLVSPRIRYHRHNGILILHRLQGCRHLSRSASRALRPSGQIQHSLLPTRRHAKLLLSNLHSQSPNLWSGPDKVVSGI